MFFRRKFQWVSRVSCGAAVALFWAQYAFAGGFAFPTFGGEHSHPTTENPTAVYYNPGALTLGEGTQLFVDGTLVVRHVEWDHAPAASDDTSVPGANDGKAQLTNVLVSPFLGAKTKFGDLSVGVGAYAPFGGSAEWDKNEAFRDDPERPGAVDGVQRWHNISGSLRSLYFTGAAAYPVFSWLSLGASINAISTEAEQIRARTVSGQNDLRDEGRSYVKVSGWQWSFGVGLLVEPIEEKLWLGASYQSAPNVDGRFQLDGTLTNVFPPTRPQAASSVELSQRYPDMVRFGGKFRPTSRIELRLFGDFERWSVLEEQCLAAEDNECATNDQGENLNPGTTILQNVKRDWKNTYQIRGGVSFWTDDDRDVELYAGAGFNSSAVPARTFEPALADSGKVTVAAGGRFRLVGETFLSTTYTYLHIVPRDTSGKSELPSFPRPTNSPDGGGKYSGRISFLNVGVEVGF